MSMSAPDWLARRSGSLKLGSDGQTWYVLIDHEPQYSLTAVPVMGQFGCDIRQTNNGRRIESKGVHPSLGAAIQAGLDNLRKALGWE